MDLFPLTGQIDPKLRRLLDEASLILCEWYSKADKSSPLPEFVSCPEVEPSSKGISRENLLEELHKIIDGSYHPSCPGALAHLDPPPLTSSILGEMVSAGLNNNLLANELSPSLSELERSLCKWMANKLGMPKHSGGVAASGGSLSNLMALVIARNKANLSFDSNIAIIASSDSHVSISRALRVMGLPKKAFYEVNVNERGEISIEDIHEKLDLIKSQGLKCFAIVATAGTTFRGAIDPIEEIASICSVQNIWLHVDASIGGVFALSHVTSSLVKGIAHANSVTINPQKILGIAKTSSLLLVSDIKYLYNSFSTGFPYIEPSNDIEYQGGEIGIQGSRSGEILKLWLGLRQLGLDGISSILENSINRRIFFNEKLDNDLFRTYNGPLHIISLTPKSLSSNQSFEWAKQTKDLLLKNNFMLSRPLYNNRYNLKAVFGNPNTQLSHIESLAKLLNNSAKDNN